MDDLMLTPGMLKREFGPKVSNLVKVYEDHALSTSGDVQHDEEEEDEFEPITLAEFLTMTNISFLDGLGPSMRRRTFVPPEGLSGFSRKAGFGDYAKAGAVSIPMLELYQFVSIPVPCFLFLYHYSLPSYPFLEYDNQSLYSHILHPPLPRFH